MSRLDAQGAQRRVPEVAPAGAGRVASDMAMSLPSTKVRDWHLQRKAVVYIRQSTPQQVLDHRESADRQYGLVHRAAALGWPQAGVEVVDEDQGRSGQTAEGRPGWVAGILLQPVDKPNARVIVGTWESRDAWAAWHRDAAFRETRTRLDRLEARTAQEWWHEVLEERGLAA